MFNKPATNVNAVDLHKMEKINNLVVNLFKTKKVFKAFLSLLMDLKSCINCSIVTLFMFDARISDHKMKDYCFM